MSTESLLTRSRSASSNPAEITEFYHGTSLEAALCIQTGGFRTDLAGKNAGTKLGCGTYITTTLEKALSYAKKMPNAGCVFKLKVDLGNCKELSKADPLIKTWHEVSHICAVCIHIEVPQIWWRHVMQIMFVVGWLRLGMVASRREWHT